MWHSVNPYLISPLRYVEMDLTDLFLKEKWQFLLFPKSYSTELSRKKYLYPSMCSLLFKTGRTTDVQHRRDRPKTYRLWDVYCSTTNWSWYSVCWLGWYWWSRDSMSRGQRNHSSSVEEKTSVCWVLIDAATKRLVYYVSISWQWCKHAGAACYGSLFLCACNPVISLGAHDF